MSKKLKYIYQSPPHIKQNNTYFLTSGHKDSGTYSLEQAEHFCPLYSKAERIVPFTTQSRINVGRKIINYNVFADLANFS